MKKLTKEFLTDRDDLLKKLIAARDDLEEAVNEFNEKLDALKQNLQEKVEDYNNTLNHLESWRDEVVSAMENYRDERSEKWHESSVGQAYDDWISEYQNIELDEIEVDMPDDVDIPETNHCDDIENLPEHPAEE
jgi:regulator of replication initiation timing